MAESQRILIADTDQKLNSQLTNILEHEEYEVKTVHTLAEFTDPVHSFQPDLLILDPSISGSDPRGYLQKFWEATHIPVLVVSAMRDVSSIVLWLEMGADDYLIKPFDFREFLARVHALLRRRGQCAPARTSKTCETLQFPDLTISLENYTVLYKDKQLPMPPKEIELLYFLAASAGQVFTRTQLLQSIWGYDYTGDTRTVDVHIKRIRRKLPASPNWCIETVWGVGYKFQLGN